MSNATLFTTTTTPPPDSPTQILLMGLKVGMDLGTLGPYAEPPPDTTLPGGGKAGEISHVDLAGHQSAAAAALSGTLRARALLSGLEGSALTEQAGGPLQRWVAAWAARGQRHFEHAALPAPPPNSTDPFASIACMMQHDE